jgi:hypothetical protein
MDGPTTVILSVIVSYASYAALRRYLDHKEIMAGKAPNHRKTLVDWFSK